MCLTQLNTIVLDNGLSPDRRQAIIWNNDGILLLGPVGRNFSEILIEIYTFSFTKIHLKMSSAKQRPFCLGLNGLNPIGIFLRNPVVMLFTNDPLGHINPQHDQYIHSCLGQMKQKNVATYEKCLSF